MATWQIITWRIPARADMYRRLGRTAEARSSYEKALALTQQEPEQQFLQDRIRQLK
jgi:RNA polymerase sigma-70 factor (ECF subfamily)